VRPPRGRGVLPAVRLRGSVSFRPPACARVHCMIVRRTQTLRARSGTRAAGNYTSATTDHDDDRNPSSKHSRRHPCPSRRPLRKRASKYLRSYPLGRKSTAFKPSRLVCPRVEPSIWTLKCRKRPRYQYVPHCDTAKDPKEVREKYRDRPRDAASRGYLTPGAMWQGV